MHIEKRMHRIQYAKCYISDGTVPSVKMHGELAGVLIGRENAIQCLPLREVVTRQNGRCRSVNTTQRHTKCRGKNRLGDGRLLAFGTLERIRSDPS